MRTIVFFIYCLAAIAGILYYAIPIGGHVSGGLLTSMAGGYGYAVIFLIVALIVFILAKPGAASVGRSGLGLLVTGGLLALIALFLRPAPPGHMGLSAALFGLAVLMLLFTLTSFGKKA